MEKEIKENYYQDAVDKAKHCITLALHQAIHKLHEDSDVLLDNKKENDLEALKKVEDDLKCVMKCFNIRFSLQ